MSATGVGVLETFVRIMVRLTPEGIITTYGEMGTVTKITKPLLFNSTNPATIDAKNTTRALPAIYAISAPCTISISNFTPGSNMMPQPGVLNLLGSILDIDSNMTLEVEATLRIYYSPLKVAETRLDEGSIKVFSWDGTQWVTIESSQVNMTDHYVSARITHLSHFAAMIQIPRPFYSQWWFCPSMAIAATVAVGLLLYWRRN